MTVRIDPEQLVGESLPDFLHIREVEYHCPESVEPGDQSPGLGTGDQLLVTESRQPHRHDGLREVVIIRGIGEPGIDFRGASAGVECDLHEDCRPIGEHARPLLQPIVTRACVVVELQTICPDLEGVEHARGKEDTLARVPARVGRQFPFRQLEERLSHVRQTQCTGNPGEDSDPVVGHDHAQRLANRRLASRR
ncbi:MAG: hypothetical protein V5B34_18480 [Accumulibacter sp.]|jgi:hypothetical protein